MSSRYPKAGPVGGRLIRETVSLLKAQNVDLPINSHILIAISGGADSVALAHLMIHLGRRVAAPEQIGLLHVNHGWRGEESDSDEAFVRELAAKWNVPIEVHRLKKLKGQGESWEEEAREARKRIFAQAAAKNGALILTAHHGEDLAETLLWRIFTGQADTHGGGIALRHGMELRPFLRVRKETLQAYLNEVGQEWREDRTNHEGRFLRSRIRQEILPGVERLFPRAVEHLIALGIKAQSESRGSSAGSPAQIQSLIGAAGLKARRSHWERLETLVEGEIHLPGGWKLIKQPATRSRMEKWVLEKI